MFGKSLAHDETYYKEYGEYKVTNSYTVYETYIEEMHDKDGKVLLNKDGSPRYRYYQDNEITTLKEDTLVKEIREGLYKNVYQVNGDYVELVERDDHKRVYYVVEPNKIKTLEKGSVVSPRNGLYRLLKQVGYVLVDDYEIERPKVIAVRKFTTDDHEQEAKEIVRNKIRRNTGDEQQ